MERFGAEGVEETKKQEQARKELLYQKCEDFAESHKERKWIGSGSDVPSSDSGNATKLWLVEYKPTQEENNPLYGLFEETKCNCKCGSGGTEVRIFSTMDENYLENLVKEIESLNNGSYSFPLIGFPPRDVEVQELLLARANIQVWVGYGGNGSKQYDAVIEGFETNYRKTLELIDSLDAHNW
ncbi:hypothetical protein HOG16_04270 [Candidatus Woesearchaeota archaeon]|jgi:hypothetical protein|nr:hypothetical protein [Candidatus Woesearchaeota archaeon]MBT4321931.1 hypothetical protein [Candidatus Woesearchaeota archaeon]MBT4631283.1 hypothetical protein [Candidatus Woesearchaeota archaeon]